jgi:hypothetical protein
MGKLLLVSLIVASVAIPARAALGPDPRRALRRALAQTLFFDAAYAFAVLVVYPRL